MVRKHGCHVLWYGTCVGIKKLINKFVSWYYYIIIAYLRKIYSLLQNYM